MIKDFLYLILGLYNQIWQNLPRDDDHNFFLTSSNE